MYGPASRCPHRTRVEANRGGRRREKNALYGKRCVYACGCIASPIVFCWLVRTCELRRRSMRQGEPTCSYRHSAHATHQLLSKQQWPLRVEGACTCACTDVNTATSSHTRRKLKSIEGRVHGCVCAMYTQFSNIKLCILNFSSCILTLSIVIDFFVKSIKYNFK